LGGGSAGRACAGPLVAALGTRPGRVAQGQVFASPSSQPTHLNSAHCPTAEQVSHFQCKRVSGTATTVCDTCDSPHGMPATGPSQALHAMRGQKSCEVVRSRAAVGTVSAMKRDSRPQVPLLLCRAAVERLCGRSRCSLWRAMRQGEFPEPLGISARGVRWRSDEVRAWIYGRPRSSGVAVALVRCGGGGLA